MRLQSSPLTPVSPSTSPTPVVSFQQTLPIQPASVDGATNMSRIPPPVCWDTGLERQARGQFGGRGCQDRRKVQAG